MLTQKKSLDAALPALAQSFEHQEKKGEKRNKAFSLNNSLNKSRKNIYPAKENAIKATKKKSQVQTKQNSTNFFQIFNNDNISFLVISPFSTVKGTGANSRVKE